ncbi:RNA-binding protein MEX3D [Pseudonaja textilis]|uniref:Mex-3 RNA binding family member D n=1 Tax=Pseudonaja textilis TaxID=8673 RepID=A0A670XS23_PSETE|nr:RNA-binding protein MEX3D [Pseudonaja textilis]
MPSAIYQLDGEASRCCPPSGLGGLLTPQIAQQPACSGSSFALPAGPEQPSLKPPSPPLLQEAEAPLRDSVAELSLALEQLSILGLAAEEEEEEEGEGGREEAEEEEAAAKEDGRRRRRGGGGGGPRPEDDLMEAGDPGGLDPFGYHGLPPLAAAPPAGGGLVLLEAEGSPPASNSVSPVEILGAFPPHLGHPPPPQHPLLAGQLGIIGSRKKSVNMTECVSVPSSEHVAEIVGRQGCKIKALRAKTNTYIKTPVRGEEPIFIVTGRKEDVEMAKREILSAAEHFSVIRATRNKVNGMAGSVLAPPNLPGQTTIQVRVPYRVVGLVVGPKGATIKRIQQQTHTYIVTPSRDKEPVFEVTGMPENVDRAREEIEAHITMRTGSFIDININNDFHSNGTDVCLDLMGGNPSSLWSKAPHPTRRTVPSLRNDNLGSSGSATSATEPYFGGHVVESPPTGSFVSNNSSYSFSEPPAPGLGSDDGDFGFDFLALDLTTPTTIWSPFEAPSNSLQAFSSSSTSSVNGNAQRRNSTLSTSATPRHSPTLPDPGMALEHPLARRIQSDPVSALSWLPAQGSMSSFSNSTGYSSSSPLPSSISATSGSPTDSNSSERAHKNSRECMVCFESEVIAALVPCGHNLFCMECAMRICGRVEPQCPACHAPATQAIHIFS